MYTILITSKKSGIRFAAYEAFPDGKLKGSFQGALEYAGSFADRGMDKDYILEIVTVETARELELLKEEG